jgi:hypothetical protein
LIWFFIKHCGTTANSVNGSVNTENVLDRLTTAIDIKKRQVNNLRRQVAQVVVLKMTLAHLHTFSTLHFGVTYGIIHTPLFYL